MFWQPDISSNCCLRSIVKCLLPVHLTRILVVWCLATSPNPPTRVQIRTQSLFFFPLSFSLPLSLFLSRMWFKLGSAFHLNWAFVVSVPISVFLIRKNLHSHRAFQNSHFLNKSFKGVKNLNRSLWAEVVPLCQILHYFRSIVGILSINKSVVKHSSSWNLVIAV